MGAAPAAGMSAAFMSQFSYWDLDAPGSDLSQRDLSQKNDLTPNLSIWNCHQ
jgi:hypothetical protein